MDALETSINEIRLTTSLEWGDGVLEIRLREILQDFYKSRTIEILGQLEDMHNIGDNLLCEGTD
tara:strand:+ start:4909 stop:5100 length:192 start_codon:yes stop_codon:yes gene_type:complete